MSTPYDISQMRGLDHITARAPKSVVNAIHKASTKTGVDFAYMMKQANAESSFNPQAKAKTSSATGLYQFINSTWMDMVDKHGAKYGINTNQSRSNILAMRNNPEISSYMAAEFAAENKTILQEQWGGNVGATEQYFAHFMGANGASEFLNARDDNGSQKAAHLFPKAAKVNRSIFYDSATGQPKTLDQVYARFDKKFGDDDATLQTASYKPTKDSVVFKNTSAAATETIAWNQITPSQNYHTLLNIAAKPSLPETIEFPFDTTSKRGRAYNPIPSQQLAFNPLDILLLTQNG